MDAPVLSPLKVQLNGDESGTSNIFLPFPSLQAAPHRSRKGVVVTTLETAVVSISIVLIS